MKRRIALKDLKGITISKKNEEFVVHVENDYDYLFSSEKFCLNLNQWSYFLKEKYDFGVFENSLQKIEQWQASSIFS